MILAAFSLPSAEETNVAASNSWLAMVKPETATPVVIPAYLPTPSPELQIQTTNSQTNIHQTPSSLINSSIFELPFPNGLSEVTATLPPAYLNDLIKQYPLPINSVRVFKGQNDGCAMTMNYNNQLTAAGWVFEQNYGSSQPIVSSGGTCRGIYQKDKIKIDTGGINLITRSGPPVDFYAQISSSEREGVKNVIGTSNAIFLIYIMQV
ncbi:MAG: hypothetical protein BGO39_06750 [Chloroflexi bacterium 54-19]|nr:MAG: hypothetical protein BGO39_06750 [Chloroflexi bacterium 54-19]